ncbi:hypothetical protein FRB94_009873 [Tulasnella sp. JGI-2019a]|nr:hypothetical protein FRB93_013739 [Tulasnella sp. JGI-2019a]KAG9010792.1 hypothetical protein FRB94_009873 [Tulasnella sp. JGI-2019a]
MRVQRNIAFSEEGSNSCDIFLSPKLRSHGIQYFSLDSGLRTLKVESGVPSPSTSQLRRLLMACPDLTELHLRCNEDEDEDGGLQLLDATLVDLSSCTSLQLFVDSGAARFVLKQVRAPICTNFVLHTKCSSEIMGARAPLIVSSLLAALDHSSRLSVRISASDLLFHTEDPHSFHVYPFHIQSPSASLAWLLDHIQPQLPKLPITFDNRVPLPLIQHTLEIMSSTITVLELNYWKSLDRAIQLLAHPRQIDGALQWPLPGLQELILTDCLEFDPWVLVRLVERRLGIPAPSLSPGQQEPITLPAELLRLHLPRWMSRAPISPTIARLRELVNRVDQRS